MRPQVQQALAVFSGNGILCGAQIESRFSFLNHAGSRSRRQEFFEFARNMGRIHLEQFPDRVRRSGIVSVTFKLLNRKFACLVPAAVFTPTIANQPLAADPPLDRVQRGSGFMIV